MSIQAITPSAGDSAKWAQVNQNFATIRGEQTRKSFKNPNTRQDGYIQGQLPNSLGTGFIMNDNAGIPAIYGAVDNSGKPVLKVAKEGMDATTAGDNDLVFNSARNFFKIVATGAASVSYTNSGAVFNTDIPHGLTGTPIVQAFLDIGSARVQVPYYVLGYGGSGSLNGVSTGFWVVSDSSFISFRVATSPATTPGTANFKYYIIAESAA